MGIDNIKPVGNPPLTPSSAEGPADSTKPDRTFADAQDKLRPSSSEPGAPPVGVAAQFNRAELQDPAKLDQMVRASVTEMVDAQSTPGPLSNNDKASLVDFLSGDPLVRQQIETYLRKVLA